MATAGAPAINAAVPVMTDKSPDVAPGTTTLEESYADKVVGGWKSLSDDKQVLFWQFGADGNMTAGSTQGSRELTGNWTSIGFKNLFELQAAGTNSTGGKTAYDIVFYYDLDKKGVYVQDPAEYRNWTFTRLP